MGTRVALSLVIVVCFLLGVRGASLGQDQDWLSWKQKYGMVYASARDEATHRQRWLDNLRLVESHNNRADVDFKLEMNQFADQIIQRPPLRYESDVVEGATSGTGSNSVSFAPSTWDWRTKGAISPVESQGQQGSAVAFAAEEELDSYSFIKTGQLASVSVAELIDCCDSALINVFACVKKIGGVCSEASYPSVQHSCRNDSCSPVVKVAGGAQVPSGDEKALMLQVYQIPVMAAMDASHASFQLYRSGIYSERRCSSIKLDHGVQIVGYGSMNGKDFWICKNSWGTSWGMEGYFLLARNKHNMCGIATAAYYPL